MPQHISNLMQYRESESQILFLFFGELLYNVVYLFNAKRFEDHHLIKTLRNEIFSFLLAFFNIERRFL